MFGVHGFVDDVVVSSVVGGAVVGAAVVGAAGAVVGAAGAVVTVLGLVVDEVVVVLKKKLKTARRIVSSQRSAVPAAPWSASWPSVPQSRALFGTLNDMVGRSRARLDPGDLGFGTTQSAVTVYQPDGSCSVAAGTGMSREK